MKFKKPRLLILTDIGGDPDDEQSLVRLLVHANEFDIEGIIPEFWNSEEHKKKLKIPQNQIKLVEDIIEAYGQVRNNLCKHHKEYPPANVLMKKVKRGMVNIPFALDEESGEVENIIGEGRDTEGSEWIIKMVDKDDPRPLNIAVWGGTADLAQALWKIQNNRNSKELKSFISKIRVHAISDQDMTGPWIRNNFPEMFYILNHARNGDKWESCYRGMFLGGNESLTSKEWVLKNVKKNHGPLGKCYPLKTATGPNPHGCLKEGDTPSWFYFLPVGLNDPDHPEWGSWGGRFSKIEKGNIYRDAIDCVEKYANHRTTVWRWRPYYQNEFQTRMDWCVKSYKNANHKPVAIINGDKTKKIIKKEVRPGQKISLDASSSYDPDGDKLYYKWWFYKEAGRYNNSINIEENEKPIITIKVPKDGINKDVHIILEVTDDGDPSLTVFRRIIFQIKK
ncbi:MAG: nucleoside hydrolase-like domain-containing protein [Bacillota bacterium]